MKQAALMGPISKREAPHPPAWVGEVARRDAEFDSHGDTCRAWVFAPPAKLSRPLPCIVMAHGLGGTRECSIEPYAQRFARAGFFVVLFDYRRLDASNGEPQQVIKIADEIEDWRAAVAFARTLPGVDARRIGLWGTSLSGGHVVSVAAKDPTIAAISAQCPMLDGAASARLYRRNVGLVAMAKLAGAALLDSWRALAGKSPYYVPLVAPPGKLAAMATEDAYSGLMAITPRGWRNEVGARLFFSLPHYRPLRRAKSVKCPALLISCTKDSVASPQSVAEAARQIAGPARHIELPIGHFDIYVGEWFRVSSEAQLAFFAEALRPSGLRLPACN